MYQLSSAPVEGSRDDTMAYSRYYPRRLHSEQLLDSISQATGVPEQFRSLYPGTRAMQVPDPEIDSYFLEVFDRPARQLICERKNAQTLNQALHLISGDTVQKKASHPAGELASHSGGRPRSGGDRRGSLPGNAIPFPGCRRAQAGSGGTRSRWRSPQGARRCLLGTVELERVPLQSLNLWSHGTPRETRAFRGTSLKWPRYTATCGLPCRCGLMQ